MVENAPNSSAHTLLASCGGCKEQSHSDISTQLRKVATPMMQVAKLKVENCVIFGSPGNIVPLDSIGIEVVQDSEADLEKRIGIIILLKYLVTQ